MATPFQAQLVTPERVLFSGEADEVSLRTDAGEIAFLAHHEEFVAALDITVVRISALADGSGTDSGEVSGEEVRFAAHGGFVHVAQNNVCILAGVAERGDEIDVERARAALSAATERLASEGPATAPGHRREEGEPDAEQASGGPLTGALLALLAPASAEAAVRRAEVRLQAAGAASET